MSEEPSIAISEGSTAHWTDGRAGMKYRNLLPQGNWNYIASHIKVPGTGPVPDWVHYHDAQFQIIYCYKASAKLVYEDQGDGWYFRKFPDGTYDQQVYVIEEGAYVPYVDPDA